MRHHNRLRNSLYQSRYRHLYLGNGSDAYESLPKYVVEAVRCSHLKMLYASVWKLQPEGQLRAGFGDSQRVMTPIFIRIRKHTARLTNGGEGERAAGPQL